MEKRDMSIERVYTISGYLQTWGVSLGMQLIYAFIYYNGFAFFERYKVLEGGWPWQDDPDYWYFYLKPKSIAVYVINMLIIAPFTFSYNEILGIPLDFNVSKDGIPNRTVFVC